MSNTERTSSPRVPSFSFELPSHAAGLGARGRVVIDRAEQTFATDANDALLHICPFRGVPDWAGSFGALVTQTLLRDWVPERYRGAYVLEGQRSFQSFRVGNTDEACLFSFQEEGPRFHACLGLRVARAVALIELDAKSAAAWQHHTPSFNALVCSLHVDLGRLPFRIDHPASWLQAGLATYA